jgi:copper resistance protein C
MKSRVVDFSKSLMGLIRFWKIHPFMEASFAVIITFCLPLPSLAHAIILVSTPAPNTTITGPDVPILLKFNSRIDGTRSRLILVHPDKSTHSINLEKQDSPDQLKAKVSGLAAGAYVLRLEYGNP